jgi:CrcB protein
MPRLLLVMIGGAAGAALRYQAGEAALRHFGPGFPWGTLIVNLAGGLLIGMLAGLMIGGGADRPLWLLLGVGLLGGFTTFSAFSLDVLLMVERGALLPAAAYAGVSVAASVLLAFAGFQLVRALS